MGEYADSSQREKKLWYEVGLIRQETKKWDEAIAAFTAAGDNDEAKKHTEECLYQKAIFLCEKTKTGEATAEQAIGALLAISNPEHFKQARDAFKDANVFYERWAAEFRTGNTILFGMYEQDNDLNNGPEPISWKIICSQDGKALLLSEKVIDAMSFMKGKRRTETSNLSSEEIWRQSEIYEWIRDVFSNSFSTQETAMFTAHETGDILFILDNIEYKRYCGEEDSSAVAASLYAAGKDGTHHDLLYYRKNSDGNRVPGTAVMQWIRTGAIKEESYLYPDDLGMIAGVRPAAWICYEQGPTAEWIESRFPAPVLP